MLLLLRPHVAAKHCEHKRFTQVHSRDLAYHEHTVNRLTADQRFQAVSSAAYDCQSFKLKTDPSPTTVVCTPYINIDPMNY